jgi:glycosyltransferase involved in cell wall biosynthesis
LNIVTLTPGAAGMYCGGCMRDNALTAALRRAGHDALQVPLYTPLKTDETDNSLPRVFFGGINVYLQQKSSLLRRLPEWLEKRMDDPAWIRFATRFGVKTKPEELGEMTVSMLQGEEGNQAREIEKLAEWLSSTQKPDVICFSNALMIGMAKRLRTLLNVPLVCTLQGEDFFLDHLPPQSREKAWSLLRDCAAHIDAFIAVSRYYAGVMSARLNLPAEKVHAVHNGIDLSEYAPATQKHLEPAIVYLARMAPEKGLKTLVDAFKLLRKDEKHARVRLRIGGSLTGNDKDFVRALRNDLKRAKLDRDVDFLPNLDKAEKIALLQSGTVFSVPATYGEAFGLFVLEALACGVPVVQPRHGAFPEILAETGGGVLCEPDSAVDLADNLAKLLSNPEKAAALGEQGRQRVLEKYGVDRMAADVAAVLKRVA